MVENKPHRYLLQEAAGHFLAATVFKPIDFECRMQEAQFHIRVHGLDNVATLDTKHPALYASNHAAPHGIRNPVRKLVNEAAKDLQFVPNAYILPDVLKQILKVDATVVAQYNAIHGENTWQGKIQRIIPQEVRRQVMIDLGYITTNTEDDDPRYKEAIENLFAENKGAIIFPEFMHNKGAFGWNDPREEKLLGGLIAMSIKYNVPIVPIYTHGDDTWEVMDRVHDVNVFFGQPFYIHELVDANGKRLKKDALRDEVKRRFRNVKDYALGTISAEEAAMANARISVLVEA